MNLVQVNFLQSLSYGCVPVFALFIFFNRGPIKTVEKNSKYVAIFSSTANLLLALFLWYSFDSSTSNFQFVEEKNWIKGLINFQLGIDGISVLFIFEIL